MKCDQEDTGGQQKYDRNLNRERVWANSMV